MTSGRSRSGQWWSPPLSTRRSSVRARSSTRGRNSSNRSGASSGGRRREVGRAVAHVGEVLHQHLGAVGAAPPVLGGLLARLAAEPAPDDGRLHPEPAQELRDLGRVAERVGDVADVHARAERARRRAAPRQVADEGLAADEERVGEDVPRPEGEAALRNEALDLLSTLRPHREVVLDDDGLAVEQEALEVWTLLQNRQEVVQHVDEPDAEVVEREVPLPVPVAVRYDVVGRHRRAGLSGADSDSSTQSVIVSASKSRRRCSGPWCRSSMRLPASACMNGPSNSGQSA